MQMWKWNKQSLEKNAGKRRTARAVRAGKLGVSAG
jgi:hypothetical protein